MKTENNSIKLGSQHGGGTVFWLSEDGTNGLIMANQDQAHGGVDWPIAMELAKNYRDPEGHDDWRLPNKDELNEMYEYCKANKELNGEVYWSSSESSDSADLHAWDQYFSNGLQYLHYKIYVYFCVRAIRAFNISINIGEEMSETVFSKHIPRTILRQTKDKITMKTTRIPATVHKSLKIIAAKTGKKNRRCCMRRCKGRD
jgi:hypothetical protein